MRGKIVLSLALVLVMLFGTVKVSVSQDPTTISVNPSLVTKLPGEMFSVNIDLANVADLYTYAFELHYAPFGNMLALRRVLEGPLLGSDGEDTDFSYTISVLDGKVQVGNTRLGEVGGISGSGTLATIEFVVVDAGACPLALRNTELMSPAVEDPQISHVAVDGFFNGAHGVADAYLTGVRGDSAIAKAGDTITLSSSVTHAGANLPVQVQVRYDLLRRDGRTLTFWTPQSKTYILYVDGFYTAAQDWTAYGTGPYLDAVGDGNYVEAGDYCSMSAFYTFEDLPGAFDPGEYVSDVRFQAYTSSQSLAIDGDVYIFNDAFSWWWSGSIECGATWDWYFTEYQNFLEIAMFDEATINSAEMLLHYWTPDGSSGPTMAIDAARLVITTSTEIILEPGETVDMPDVVYTLVNEDKGVYRSLTATVYVTSIGLWNACPEQIITVLGEDGTPRDYLIVTGKPTKA